MLLFWNLPMKQLILCEKPQLARFTISCLKENFEPKKFKGSDAPTYFESPHYFVSWSFGHLFEAYDIEDYTKTEQDWTLDNLPFCPPDNHFLFKLKQRKNPTTGEKETDPGYRLQFDTIYYLINLPEVNGVIHYGDAAREGEVIIRQIIKNTLKSDKPIMRLWVNAMVPEAFYQSFSNMKYDREYDNYFNEGIARIKIDYLYGINLTRYTSLKAKAPKGSPFGVGRVLCAMVQEIYDRELEIENFIPEKYYSLVSKTKVNDEDIVLRCKEHYPLNDYVTATEKCALLNAAGALVTGIEKIQSVIGPKKLFNLTALQGVLSSKYKISNTDSMKLIQSVYEKGYITYPRTNAQYLPEPEKANAQKLIDLFNQNGYELEMKDKKSIFDSSKVEDHGALCPTTKIPSNLSPQEMIVYETVRNRFLAVFCKEPYTVDKSVMKIQCGSEQFSISGTVMVLPGWTKYEEKDQKDTYLPQLNEGDRFDVSFTPTEEETKPPARYSEKTFGEFLENPFKKEKQTDEEHFEELMKGLEIGTVASRTGIISNMLRYGYVELKNQTYYLNPVGRYMIELLAKLGIEMTKEKTVETSVWLKNVFNGELSEDQVLEIVKADIDKMFALRDKEVPSCVDSGVVSSSGFSGDPLGECPICGGNIYEIGKGYICENNKKDSDECCFYLSKEDKFLAKVSGMKLKTNHVQSLLKNGYIIIKAKSQKGDEYECMAKLRLKDDRLGWETFYNIGKCPVCGSDVKSTPFGYICEKNNANKECFFILYRHDKYIGSHQGNKPLTLRQACTILNKGSIVITCENKDKTKKYQMRFTPMIDKINRKMTWTSAFVNKSPRKTK